MLSGGFDKTQVVDDHHDITNDCPYWFCQYCKFLDSICDYEALDDSETPLVPVYY